MTKLLKTKNGGTQDQLSAKDLNLRTAVFLFYEWPWPRCPVRGALVKMRVLFAACCGVDQRYINF